jgi:hypothetical protein
MPGEPARRFGFRDDREDRDSFGCDVIENSDLPNAESILRLAQAAQALDPVLAHPSRLVPQVPFESVPHGCALVGRQGSVSLRRLRDKDDIIAHLARR